MKDHSYKRHIAKSISWRILGTIDTVIWSWVITGSPFLGLQIGFAEVLTKMLLYYLHERVWFKLNLSKDGKLLESRKRHLAKAITWRLIGSIDTMMLAWIISGNPLTGFKIGFVEVISKLILYYLHERIWYKINYGLDNRKETKWKM